MDALFTFAEDVGSALSWLLPALCYISGSWLLLMGTLGLVQRNAHSGGFLSQPFAPEFMIFVGGILLSFPTFLNSGNTTLGFTGTAAIGTPDKTSFSSDTLTTAAAQGPAAALSAILTLWHSYFAAYGALIIYFALMRQVGRAKGANNSSSGLNMIMILGGFMVMNADVIGPNLIKELGLTS